jgi:hypothetical protein
MSGTPTAIVALLSVEITPDRGYFVARFALANGRVEAIHWPLSSLEAILEPGQFSDYAPVASILQ